MLMRLEEVEANKNENLLGLKWIEITRIFAEIDTKKNLTRILCNVKSDRSSEAKGPTDFFSKEEWKDIQECISNKSLKVTIDNLNSIKSIDVVFKEIKEKKPKPPKPEKEKGEANV